MLLSLHFLPGSENAALEEVKKTKDLEIEKYKNKANKIITEVRKQGLLIAWR